MKTAFDLAQSYASALRSVEECRKRAVGLKPRKGVSEEEWERRAERHRVEVNTIADMLRSIEVASVYRGCQVRGDSR